MTWIRRFRHLLGLGQAPATGELRSGSSPFPPDPTDDTVDLRRRIEEVLDRDDADALAELLSPRREQAKVVLAAWEGEMAETADPAERAALVRRITALVAIYARAFDDQGPLEHFRRQAPPGRLAAVRMRDAQQALGVGDLDRADEHAANGLRAIEDATDDPETTAIASSLLGIRGGVAARAERWDEALELFERALERARESGQPEAVAAGVLNLVDAHTRRGTFSDADSLLDEAPDRVRGGPYEDVLGKMLAERGIAQTRAGELEGAVATFDRAIRHKPDWPFPWYQRGWVRFLSGDSGGALDDYRECASRRSVFFTVQREIRCLEDVAAGRLPIEAYRSFSAIRDRIHDRPEQVEEAATRMTDRWPAFAPAWLLRAEARLAHGDAEGAREAASTAMRSDPDQDTGAAALFLEWNVARKFGDEGGRRTAEDRLQKAYVESPAAHLVRKIHEVGDRDVALRWTFGLDGTLQIEEVKPPDRTLPPPARPE